MACSSARTLATPSNDISEFPRRVCESEHEKQAMHENETVAMATGTRAHAQSDRVSRRDDDGLVNEQATNQLPRRRLVCNRQVS